MPRGFVAWCVVAAVLLVGGASPAHGATAPSYVVMFSDGDWVGGGAQRLFHSGNASISVSGTPAYLTVDVAGGTFGDYFDLTFAAPPGQSLVAGGVYVDAQRAPFRSAGRPGIDISGSGRGCNTQAGHFEVKDIGVGASGAITRLWIVYTQFCEGGTRGLWGEVRIGLPTGGAPLVAPGIVRWPAGDVSRPGTVVPVTLVAAHAPVTIGAASSSVPPPTSRSGRTSAPAGA